MITEHIAREINAVLQQDFPETKRPLKLEPGTPLSDPRPDSARGQINEAVEVLASIAEDAKVLAAALEHIRSAAEKVIADLAKARKAIDRVRAGL
jgi:hypothetical protein